MQASGAVDLQQPLAGLLIDEWVEIIPNAKETTGVAFQFNPPDSFAPQSILLAVPPVPDKAWTGDSQRVLLETLDLRPVARGGRRGPRSDRTLSSRALPRIQTPTTTPSQPTSLLSPEEPDLRPPDHALHHHLDAARAANPQRCVEHKRAGQNPRPPWPPARQWQVGQGEDSGTPIMARLRADISRLTRFFPGPIAANSQVTAPAFNAKVTPLETIVERERVRPLAGARGKNCGLPWKRRSTFSACSISNRSRPRIARLIARLSNASIRSRRCQPRSAAHSMLTASPFSI